MEDVPKVRTTGLIVNCTRGFPPSPRCAADDSIEACCDRFFFAGSVEKLEDVAVAFALTARLRTPGCRARADIVVNEKVIGAIIGQGSWRKVGFKGDIYWL